MPKPKPLDFSKMAPGTMLIWVRDSRRTGAVVEQVSVRFVKRVEKKCIVETPTGHKLQVYPHKLMLAPSLPVMADDPVAPGSVDDAGVAGGDYQSLSSVAKIALDRGLKSAIEEPLVDLGDFSQYANDEDT